MSRRPAPPHRLRLLQGVLPGVDLVLADSGRAFARHTHEQFGIGLLMAGAQRSASGRGPVEAAAGDLITVNPGEVHDGVPIGDAGRRWQMLYLDPACVQAARNDAEGDGVALQAEFERPALREARLAARFGACVAALTGPNNERYARPARAPEGCSHAAQLSDLYRLAAEEALVGLLDGLLRLRPAAPVAIPAGLAQARRRIDDNPAAALSLDQLAQAAGLSRWQLVRGFVRATGLPPHAYLLQRRIALARSLIARGTPLAEVAAASGFADQSHMTRVFVRSHGLTPGAYAPARA